MSSNRVLLPLFSRSLTRVHFSLTNVSEIVIPMLGAWVGGVWCVGGCGSEGVVVKECRDLETGLSIIGTGRGRPHPSGDPHTPYPPPFDEWRHYNVHESKHFRSLTAVRRQSPWEMSNFILWVLDVLCRRWRRKSYINACQLKPIRNSSHVLRMSARPIPRVHSVNTRKDKPPITLEALLRRSSDSCIS